MPSVSKELHHNANDLSNQHFGNLTAISVIGKTSKRSLVWECRCICGNVVARSSDTLRQGKSKSCGCKQFSEEAIGKRAESQRRPGAAQRKEFNHIKTGATKRGHAFEISFDKFLELSKLPCAYCGTKFSKIVKTKYEQFEANGIDRVDNSIGYIDSNIVPCCKICNYMKRDMSVSDFLEHARKMVTYSFSF